MLNFIKLRTTLFAMLTVSSGCVVNPSCYSDADCASGQQCTVVTGKCGPPTNRCDNVADCDEQFECADGQCRALTTLYCSKNMVPVNNAFCIDAYEASRPDTTAAFGGNDESKAVSEKGVIPWKVIDNATAQAACTTSGKTLCNETQWQIACMGPGETTYAYGEKYQSATCNGIDTFCICDECVDEETCSYPHCYNECGASFKLMPTGSFPNCTNAFGVYDINGNLWEHVLNGNDTNVRGGAYNCKDSKMLHECTYVPGWVPSAVGFRCCSEGALTPPDTDSEPQS